MDKVNGVRLKHIVTSDNNTARGELIEQLGLNRHQIRLDIERECLPMGVGIEPLENTMLSPSIEWIEEEQAGSTDEVLTKKVELKIRSEEASSVGFRLHLKFDNAERLAGPYEFSAPPQKAADWCDEILSREFDRNIFDELSEYYNTSTESEAVNQLLRDTRSYLSSDQFLRLLNICGEVLPSFREEIDRTYSPAHIAGFLPGGRNERTFDIDSWPRLRQFCATSSQLRYIPDYEEEELVREAISETCHVSSERKETEFGRLWSLEQALDVSKRYPDQLNYDQFVGLLAKAAYEESYDRVRDLISHRISPSEVQSLERAIDQAQDRSSDQDWKGLLPIASEQEKQQKALQLVLANFLQEAGYANNFPRPYSIFAFKASAKLFNSIGLESFSQTNRFWEYYFRGHRALKIGDFEAAKQDLEKAFEYSLQEISEYGHDRFTSLADSWFYLCRAELKSHREAGDLEIAIDYIGNTITLIDSYSDFPEEKEQIYLRTRTEALLHEAKGDKHLRDQEYSEAKKLYGMAIGKLLDIDRDLRKQIQYLKNRRWAIEASILESSGEYDNAANTYDKIVSESSDKDSFVLFQETRSKLCDVKEAIVEYDFDLAEQHLNQVNYKSSELQKEINQIESLLELLRKYHQGNITNMGKAWDILESAEESDHEQVDIDIGFGHDYRPAFINILGAQRLKNIIENEEIIDPLVDIAIRDVLNPTDIERIIDIEGLNYSSFSEEWKNRIPDFLTRQIQEVKQEATKKRSGENYFSQVKILTGLLEECLEVFVAYDARERHGTNWQYMLDQNGDITMMNLRDYVNKNIFHSDEIGAEVRQLLSQEKFGDIVLDDQREDIVGVRNDCAHNNISSISETEYHRVRDHVHEIFSTIAPEMPVLGMAGEGSQYHGHSVELLILDHRDQLDILTDAELQTEEIYYLPGDVITSESIKKIDSNKIWSQEAEDILESIDSHSDIEIS